MAKTTVQKKKRIDLWHWPSSLLFLGVILYIGYHFFETIQERNRLCRDLQSVGSGKSATSGNPDVTATKLFGAQKALIRHSQCHDEQILRILGLNASYDNSALATFYQSQAAVHENRNDPSPFISLSSLALLYNPQLPGLALDLGSACMKTGNLELGSYAAKLHAAENAGGGSVLEIYFGKRYRPKWQCRISPSASRSVMVQEEE